VIVTGANPGTGLETAHVLSYIGAKVIIPCRTLEKSNGAVECIEKTVPNADLVLMQLYLSDLASVKAFAQTFFELNLRLNILINNAGVMACPKSFTKDGFETQFGVNHLGHFYLTQLLTEKFKESAQSRIVNVSSTVNSQCAPGRIQ
jgi:retinol dehydrogenase-12